MGLIKGASDPDRAARARMERAADRSEQRFGKAAQDGRPRRYRLYDRIAGRVPLRAMNVIIVVTALLLVAVLVYGIATGSRP